MTMNGNVAEKFLSSIDPDDPDYQRQLMRPAEIKEDVKLMEQRKRVSLILNSEAFREELEQIIESQIRSGPQPVSLLALQQIADALQLPRSASTGVFTNGSCTTANGQANTARPAAAGFALPGAPLPISDIRGVDSLSYSKGEKLLRCKLASACRLLDVLGWATAVPGASSLSARVGGERENASFLATPFGLLAHEVTASSLLKVDNKGQVLDSGSTLFGLHGASWLSMDAPLYNARPSLRCIVHLRTPSTVAISATRQGLQLLSLESVACGRVAMVTGASSVAREAGEANVLLVRNMGLVCCGESVEEAFYFVQQAVQACEAQLAAATLGDELCLLDDTRKETLKASLDAQLAALPKAPLSVDSPTASPMNVSLANASDSFYPAAAAGKWSVGEVEFEALMRYLDNAGFRTGYPYRISVAKHGQKTREGHSDVQIPPTVSSLTDELQQYDLAHGDGQASQLLKEVSAAKKSATLPLPKATAPSIAPETKKEYKDQHARVRDQYYKDAVSGGPQSRVLDGITWNEAQKLRETAESQGQHGPAVTAASKAIIQREKQGDAVIYKGHTERNPFDKVSDQELHDYVDQVSGRKPPQSPQAAVQVDVRTLPNDAGQSAVASPSSPGAVAPQAQVTAQPQPASPEKQQGAVKAQVVAEAQATPRVVSTDNASVDDESATDTPAKKEKKKKEKSGIFASFSKKKEKSK